MVSKIPDSSARTKRLFNKLRKIAREPSSTASPDTVHDLRTTSRRIETLLSAHGMDDHGPAAKLARQLAKLRRGAGKLRDIDVHIAALDSIRLEDGSRDRGILRDHLTRSRYKRQEKLVRTLKKEASKGLLKRLRRAEEDVKTEPALTDHNDYTNEALAKFEQIAARYPELTARTLHGFRIACKRIRYLAEMGSESAGAEHVIELLKNIQDAIGEWHDWLTLTEVAKDVLPTSGSSVVAAIRTQTKSKLNEALRTTVEAKSELLEIAARAVISPDAPRPIAGATRGNEARASREYSPIPKITIIAA